MLKVIHNNSRDLESTLVYASMNANYLFSCGDGAQRLYAQAKVRFKKTEAVFVPTAD